MGEANLDMAADAEKSGRGKFVAYQGQDVIRIVQMVDLGLDAVNQFQFSMPLVDNSLLAVQFLQPAGV